MTKIPPPPRPPAKPMPGGSAGMPTKPLGNPPNQGSSVSAPQRATSAITRLRLHPAYAVVQRLEGCWAIDKDQVENRTRLIVTALATAGLIKDAKIEGFYVCQTGETA